MTDNVNVSEEELKKQKERLLSSLWANIQIQTGWDYTELTKNDLRAQIKLSQISDADYIKPDQAYYVQEGLSFDRDEHIRNHNAAIDAKKAQLEKGYVDMPYNPLLKRTNNIQTVTPLYKGATVTFLQNAIDEADKSGAKDIYEWAKNFQEQITPQIEEINNNTNNIGSPYYGQHLISKQNTNQYQRPVKNRPDFYIDKDVLVMVEEAVNSENIEKMFTRPEPIVEIDPKKKEKIKNWMKSVGLEDKSDAMIQAYGDKAYAVVQNAMAGPNNLKKVTGREFKTSKEALQFLLDNEKDLKEKVGDVDVLTIAGEKKRTLDNFNDSFMDELSKRGTAIPKEGYASLLAALKTTPNTYADLLMAMDRVANERGFDKEKVKETKDLLTDFYENKYQDVMKNNTSVKKLEKGIIIPEVNEMVGLNIETPKIELPEKIGELPGYDLSKADMDKVKYASAMLGELKINGIDDAKMADAINKAFKESMKNGIADMEAWRGNFRYNLTQELDLERKAKGNKDKYTEMMKALAGTDKMVAESLDTLPNNKVEYLSFADTVNKVNLAKDIADIKPEMAQNADNQEKVEKVETKVSRREKFKAGWNRVFGRKRNKEKAVSDMAQEREVTTTHDVETPTTDRTVSVAQLSSILKSKNNEK